METMKRLYQKHKELILYFVFGVATTVVNLITFYCLERVGSGADHAYLVNNVIAWLAAVIFAYITNKLFVFESRSWKVGVLLKELLEFFGARIFSLGIEEAGLWLFVELLNFSRISYTVIGFTLTGELIAKLMLAVIVVILNYFFSKFIIFKKKA